LAHGAGSFIRHFSDDESDFVAKISSMPPIVIGEVTFGFSPIRGEVICIMRMPNDLMSPSGKEQIVEGVRLAGQRGARVVSLGALTAPATGGGQRLLRTLPIGMTLTNGNAYTAVVVLRNVEEASVAVGLGSRARIAIIGCTGSVGVAASTLISQAGFELILVGRSATRVHHEFKNLKGRAIMTGDLGSVRKADIVVLLTNDPAAELKPDHLKDSAVVIDCAQPSNIPKSARESFVLRDIAVTQGGLVRIPEYACSYDLDLPDKSYTFACLAEAYLLARSGIRENSVGKPSASQALEIERLARTLGVGPRPLTPDIDACRNMVIRERSESAQDLFLAEGCSLQ
jgi:predicted amino acid dehydrogenase